MALFRHRRKNSEASPIISRVWYGEFTDHTGIIRRLALTKDKESSEFFLERVKRLVAYRQIGKSPNDELLLFIEGLPEKARTKLISWGIIDKRDYQVTLSIDEALERWRRLLVSARRNQQHIAETIRHVRAMSESCHIQTTNKLEATLLSLYLGQLLEQGKSARTCNAVLTACKSFGIWLTKQKLIPNNPFHSLSKFNEDVDRRRCRRAMSEEEISCLFSSLENSERHHGLSANERRILYQLAIQTGLRYNEIFCLCRNDFTFEGDYPFVRVRAASAKNKKEDYLPLCSELAGLLNDYFLASPSSGESKVFPKMQKDAGAETLQRDLRRAGIEIVDDAGEVLDFHSLRHTCGTRLARSGVSPQIAMRIMRHSRMELTLKYYTHLSLKDKAEALSTLPQVGCLPQKPRSPGMTILSEAGEIPECAKGDGIQVQKAQEKAQENGQNLALHRKSTGNPSDYRNDASDKTKTVTADCSGSYGLFDTGGERWIRTIEDIVNRFTVCPLWPLGNLPARRFNGPLNI